MKKIIFNSNKGFTLVEIMVATGIFMIIMVIGLGSLLATSDYSKSTKTLSFTMDNVNFALESMARSIRMGTGYYCKTSGSISLGDDFNTNDCPVSEGGGTFLAFIPQESTGSHIGYGLFEEQLNVNGQNITRQTIKRCDSDNNCTSLITPNVNINVLRFFVKGSDLNDGIQPSVFILIKGTITIKNKVTPFAIQTMASQRSSE